MSLNMSVAYCCKSREIVDVEVDDNATEQEIEGAIEDAWKEWVWEQLDGGWEIIDDEDEEE